MKCDPILSIAWLSGNQSPLVSVPSFYKSSAIVTRTSSPPKTAKTNLGANFLFFFHYQKLMQNVSKVENVAITTLNRLPQYADMHKDFTNFLIL